MFAKARDNMFFSVFLYWYCYIDQYRVNRAIDVVVVVVAPSRSPCQFRCSNGSAVCPISDVIGGSQNILSLRITSLDLESTSTTLVTIHGNHHLPGCIQHQEPPHLFSILGTLPPWTTPPPQARLMTGLRQAWHPTAIANHHVKPGAWTWENGRPWIPFMLSRKTPGICSRRLPGMWQTNTTCFENCLITSCQKSGPSVPLKEIVLFVLF